MYTEQEQRHKFRQADENGDDVLSQLEYVAFKNPMTTGYVVSYSILLWFTNRTNQNVSPWYVTLPSAYMQAP